MAFNSAAMRTSGAAGRGRLWFYTTEDDVTAANYFASFAENLRPGSRIMVTVLTSGGDYDSSAKYVVVDTAGTVEAVSSWAPPTFTPLTEVDLGANAAAAYANTARYIVTSGTGLYPDEITASGGHTYFSAGTTGSRMGGTDTTDGTKSCLYFFRFPLSAAITTAPDHAEIRLNIGAHVTADDYTEPFYVQALAAAVTWPTSGTVTAAPIGHGNYTAATAYFMPPTHVTGGISIDVTALVAEIAGTAAASGQIIFMLTNYPVEIPGEFSLENYATFMPELHYATAQSRIGYSKRAITGGNVIYHIPYHPDDLPAEDAALTTIRRTSYLTSEYWSAEAPSFWNGTSKKDSLKGAITSLGQELAGVGVGIAAGQSRRSIAPFRAVDLNYFARIRTGIRNYLMITQYKQTTAATGYAWFWDVANDLNFVFNNTDGPSGMTYRVQAAGGTPSEGAVGTFYDSIGAVKTMAIYYDSAIDQFFLGYHNGQSWEWFDGPSSAGSPEVSASGVGGLNAVPLQGLLCVEFTTLRTYAEAKAIAAEARTMWKAGHKYLPTLL